MRNWHGDPMQDTPKLRAEVDKLKAQKTRWNTLQAELRKAQSAKQAAKKTTTAPRPKASAARIKDLERQLSDASKPSARNLREIDSAKAKAAVRSNKGILSRAASAVRSSGAGRLAAKAAQSGAGRLVGSVVAKTAAPLLVAQGAYDIARIAHAGYGAAKAQEAARENEVVMAEKYGTEAAATRTRHANERKKNRIKTARDNLKQGYLIK